MSPQRYPSSFHPATGAVLKLSPLLLPWVYFLFFEVPSVCCKQDSQVFFTKDPMVSKLKSVLTRLLESHTLLVWRSLVCLGEGYSFLTQKPIFAKQSTWTLYRQTIPCVCGLLQSSSFTVANFGWLPGPVGRLWPSGANPNLLGLYLFRCILNVTSFMMPFLNILIRRNDFFLPWNADWPWLPAFRSHQRVLGSHFFVLCDILVQDITSTTVI